MAYRIVSRYGHYEAYINGQFFCTADNWSEAVREVETYLTEGR